MGNTSDKKVKDYQTPEKGNSTIIKISDIEEDMYDDVIVEDSVEIEEQHLTPIRGIEGINLSP